MACRYRGYDFEDQLLILKSVQHTRGPARNREYSRTQNLGDAHHRWHPLNSYCRAQALFLSLLYGTRRGRKHRIGVASNHPDRANHDHENHREHHGIFGDVLPLVIGPETAKEGEDHIFHQPKGNFRTA